MRVPYYSLAAAAAILVVSFVTGLVARRVVLNRLRRLADMTASRFDDVIVASLRGPLPLWFVLGGAFFASHLVKVPEDVAPIIDKAFATVVIGSITLWAAKLAGSLLQSSAPEEGSATARATGAMRYASMIAVGAIGGLVLLSTLGISVAPVLTTVGIGGLAVALGLQETLANLFAGMQITLAGNIRVGDFIKLESGEEGYVDDVHWRATRIRTLRDNFVLIPNSRLAQSVVNNYHRPTRELGVLVEIGVHYASDLGQVERVTCEVARQVMETVPGGVPNFEPIIRFHTFADSSINFTTYLRAKQFSDTFLVKHEFIKALCIAYGREGIVIPFPIRALNVEQEGVTLPVPRTNHVES